MATLRPFRGLRPTPELAGQIAAPPYDVLSSDEARVQVAQHPLSFLRVGKAEVDLPRGTDLYDDAVYSKAEANLRGYIERGELVQDATPTLYVYAQQDGTHTQRGVVGCASVREYEESAVRRHELTRKEKEDDRTRHIEVTGAQTGPVFLTYRQRPELERLLDEATREAPVYDFVADDGVGHRFWLAPTSAWVARCVAAFADVPMLYIADGHHRSAAAARVAQIHRAAGRPDGEHEYFLAVMFADSELRILEYNRLVRDLGGHTPDTLLTALATDFHVEALASFRPPAGKGSAVLYVGGRWHALRARAELLQVKDPVASLDVSIYHARLFEPLLGITDPRTDKRIDFVGGIRGHAELAARVDSGEMALGLVFFPTSMAELLAVADAGRIMPPKSTWFEPKLRDGLVIHMIA